MRSCAHKVPTILGGRKDGRTEGRNAENYVPPLFFEKAGDNKNYIYIASTPKFLNNACDMLLTAGDFCP